MSKDLEELFRESLQQHEVPYDASAWDSLNKKLSENQPENQKKNHWKSISFIVAGLAIGGYLFYSNSTPTPVKKHQIEQIKPITPLEETKDNEVKLETPSIPVKKSTNKTNQPIFTSPKNENVQIENKKPNVEEVKQIEVRESKKYLHITNKASYCQGENETFKNENDFTIYLIHESGKYHTIKSKESLDVEFKDAGQYFWSFENHLNTQNKMPAFEVFISKKVSFNVPQDFDYSNGLPSLNLTTNSPGTNRWYVNNKPYTQGNDVILNLFNKGRYEIKLVNEYNGCKSDLSKSFTSDDTYNLMSVTGIEPSHSDPKRNSFIPYALTLRNISFNMFIISPKTGEIIFETNDIDKPWKGQNQKTNELVPENSEYIWKVTIQNPTKGEKSEYKGIVTRI
jgi:hypothetical protein